MSKSICAVSGCKKPKWAKGLCEMHLWRMRVHNSVETPLKSQSSKVRFFANISPFTNEKGCLLWIGCKQSDGYGVFRVNGKKMKAHRFSYLYWVGSISAGLLICHHCDNPACVNPNHLFIGSVRDNLMDCINKGRNNPMKGERHGMAKLTTQQVFEIRRLYAIGGITQQQLAIKFEITQGHIGAIILGKSWKHLSSTELSAVGVQS